MWEWDIKEIIQLDDVRLEKMPHGYLDRFDVMHDKIKLGYVVVIAGEIRACLPNVHAVDHNRIHAHVINLVLQTILEELIFN